MPTPLNGGSQHSTLVIQPSSSSQVNTLLGAQRWSNDSGTLTLTYSFPWKNGRAATWDTNNYSSLREPDTGYGLSSQERDAVRAALKAWSAVANINFVEVEESSTSVGDLRFAWTKQNNPGAAAWAYEPSSWWTSGGDVWLSNSGMSSYTQPSDWLPGGGAFSTLLHEIGHALGLKHPFEDPNRLTTSMDSDQYTVMSYTQHPYGVWGSLDAPGTYNYHWLSPETPMLLDIAAMQSLYGTNTQASSGNDVYTITAGTAVLRTLWDAGGQDTLSIASFSRGAYIDLQPGAFSSLPSLDAPPAWADKATYGKDNLAIAWDTTIENVVGGSGDDTLLGNSASNRLQGGAGNDTIDGRAGVDIAVYSTARANYDIQRLDSNRYTVTQRDNGADGKDTLTSVERLQFSDQRVAMDVANGGDAGFTAQLIGAVYGAANARNPQLVGIGLKLLDSGTTHEQLVKMALQDRLGTGYTPDQYISTLYQNLTGQAIRGDQLVAWKARVASGEFTDVSLTLAASTMAENNANIGLVGLIETGIAYT